MADRHQYEPAQRPALKLLRAVRRPLFIFFLIASASGIAMAAERLLPNYKSLGELPASVTEAFKPVADGCEWHISQLVVRAFWDDILSSIRCASNHSNQIHSYVIAKDDKGTNAKLLLFPTPRNKNGYEPLDAISNAEYLGASREITHNFTNPE